MRSQITRSSSFLLLWEAFNSLLPIVLTMNILVLFSGFMLILSSSGGLEIDITSLESIELSRLYTFLLPLFFNLSLSTLLAKEKGLDPIGTQLIAMICFFRVTGFFSIDSNYEPISQHGSILTSIACTWLSVRLFHYLSGFSQLQIKPPSNSLSPKLRKTFSLAIASILTVSCFELTGYLLRHLPTSSLLYDIDIFVPYFNQLGDFTKLVIYKTIALVSWFIGLHGEHSAEGVFHVLSNGAADGTKRLQLDNLHNVFMNIGGSGSTFILPLLILKSKRLHQFQAIARFSLPFSFFNVNEILMFGIPIILNPILLIPFLLAPFLNLIIVVIALNLNLFSIQAESIHWMAVPIYSAYQLSGGSLWAIATQLLCIGIDGCLYFPFLLIASRQAQAPQQLRQLFSDEQYGFLSNALAQREEQQSILQNRNDFTQLTLTQEVLEKLRRGRLTLHYQPKFAAEASDVVGFEALLRLQDRHGNIAPPTFLPVLYEQGLSKVIDQKVVDLTFSHALHWQRLGLKIPKIAINFDKHFLLDGQAIRAFISQANQYQLTFDIEITEHTCIDEIERLSKVVNQLRRAGHRVAIDDFGSGYSALTTLVQLNANEIKLDNKFIQIAFSHTRGNQPCNGETLLKSTVQLCHNLGLNVVAEGIETREQLKQVQRCGVDVVQGYYLGRPMSPQQVTEFLSDDWNQSTNL